MMNVNGTIRRDRAAGPTRTLWRQCRLLLLADPIAPNPFIRSIANRREPFAMTSAVRLFAIFLLVALTALAAPPSRAAGEDPAPDVVTGDLEALAAILADDAKRQELLTAVRGLIAAKKQVEAPPESGALGETLAEAASTTVETTSEILRTLFTTIRGVPEFMRWATVQVSDPRVQARGLARLEDLAIILAFGWTAEFLAWLALMRPRRSIASRSTENGLSQMALVVSRLVLGIIPLAVFFGAAYATYGLVDPSSMVKEVGLNFVYANLVARGAMVLAHIGLSPGAPQLRFIPLNDRTARFLTSWIRRFVWAGLIGYLLAEMARLFGAPPRAFEVMLKIVGTLLLVLGIVFVLQARARLAIWLRIRAKHAKGAVAASFLAGLAPIWHLLAIGYLCGVFATWAWTIEGGLVFLLRGTLLTLIILGLAWMASAGVRHLARQLAALSAKPSPAHTAFGRRIGHYGPLISLVLRGLIYLLVVLLTLEAWEIDALAVFKTPFGQRLLGALLSIGIVSAFALLVWEGASVAIERYLGQTDAVGRPIERSARARTLLPLIRRALLVFLSVLVVLITLSELGIDIAPLLAGAGVIGLAVGFGAQKLVQDVITGLFILLEDAVAVGDVVKVAGISGSVEDLSIRSIRMRDLAGSLHTIPFSSVDTVTNMTKDFAYYLLDIGVSYDDDTDRMAEICSVIVEEMREDPQFGHHVLEPLEVLGVDAFSESAVMLKARIKTRPLKQWAIGREFNRRLKKRLDELGIDMPYRRVTVYFGEDKPEELFARLGREDSARAATAAAAPTVVPPPPPPEPERPLERSVLVTAPPQAVPGHSAEPSTEPERATSRERASADLPDPFDETI